MELRSQETAIRIVVLAVLSIARMWSQELRYEVRHERAFRGDHRGSLIVDDEGISYEQALSEKQKTKVVDGKHPKFEKERFLYEEIQQLWISPEKLVLVTYKDRKWLGGIDKEFEFFPAVKGQSFEPIYVRLKGKLDQRLTSAVADSPLDPEWALPVKLLGTIQGSQGVLQISSDRIVYKTAHRGASRTWRYEDIENISTSGPFQLTLTSFERAKTHYGSLRGFNFQLKRKLDEKQFDLLWKRLNREKGLTFLRSMEERAQ